MMKIFLLTLLFLNLNVSYADHIKSNDLMRDLIALELFLQDQADHETYCPEIEWEQPDLEVYKQELESQLPPECPVPDRTESP